MECRDFDFRDKIENNGPVQNLSTYSYFFTCIRRIKEKCLSAHGEYAEFRGAGGTQTRLRIYGR